MCMQPMGSRHARDHANDGGDNDNNKLNGGDNSLWSDDGRTGGGLATDVPSNVPSASARAHATPRTATHAKQSAAAAEVLHI